MSDRAPRSERPSDHRDHRPQQPPGGLDDATLAFAHRMFDLARAGGTELLDQVDAGLPADLTDARGNTLLLLAVYHGHRDLAVGLLARGAEPERVNDRGQTPLAAAAFRGLLDVVEALLAAGADPLGGTPSALETARFFDQREAAALLEDHLARGAGPRA
jgi:uncharacterized protein